MLMNNINIGQLQQFFSAVQEYPGEAKKTKQVTGAWSFEEGSPQFVSTVEYPQGKATLNTELPLFAGGWGTSPDPIQYCLHGLASCFAVTLMATATSENIALTKVEVTAENRMNLLKQMGLSEDNIIENVKFTVKAEGASRAELDRLVALSRERCPGVECLTRSVPLEVELEA
jgi:uncharacterized OsmC-like protein